MFVSIDVLSIPGAQEIVEDGEYGVFIPYRFNVSRHLDKNGKQRRKMCFSSMQVHGDNNLMKLKLSVPNEDKDAYFFSRAAAKSRIVGLVAWHGRNQTENTKEDLERIFKEINVEI